MKSDSILFLSCMQNKYRTTNTMSPSTKSKSKSQEKASARQKIERSGNENKPVLQTMSMSLIDSEESQETGNACHLQSLLSCL